MRELPIDAPQLLQSIVDGIFDVKGKEIRCLDLRSIKNRVANFFVICHGDSNTQVKAIADSIEKQTWIQHAEEPWHKEGMNNAEWVLLDFGDIVVHVFHREQRDHYRLEHLWADATSYHPEENLTKKA